MGRLGGDDRRLLRPTVGASPRAGTVAFETQGEDLQAAFKYLVMGGVGGLTAGVFVGLVLGRLGPIAAIVGGLIAVLLLTTLGVLMGFLHFEKNVVAPVGKKYWNVEDVRLLVETR